MAPQERSPNTELWKAVHAFQAEAPALQRDKINPAFKSKYLSLDSLMEQVMPLLNKHGLVWVTVPNFQTVSAGGEARIEPNLAYRLIHAESGQETKGTVPLILGKRDMQGLGSAVTYGRRYALMCVLGLVADEDDDGNKASERSGKANGGARVSAPPAQRTEGTATAKQRGLIFGKAGEKNLPPTTLAEIVNAAAEGEVKDFESQSAAEDWLRRALDRLPARLVDPVLKGIEQAEPEEALPL